MEADILHKKRELNDLRKDLLNDLHKFIDNKRKNGNTIFLVGDINDDLGMETGQVRNFLQSVVMRMTYTMWHQETEELPPTHGRGTKYLEMIRYSDHVPDTAVIRAGYTSFYFNFFTDHRGVYIDLDIISIFNISRHDTTTQIHKRFTTRHVQKCSKCLHKLEELFEASKLFKKVDKLEERYNKIGKEKGT